MTPIKRALFATALATATVGTFAGDAELLSAGWRWLDTASAWRDAAAINLAEPGAVGLIGLVVIALGTLRRRRSLSESRQ